MYEILQKTINRISPLSQKSFDLILPHIKRHRIPKNTILCKSGEVPTDVYFIERGLVRAYTTNPKGNEYNLSIFHDMQFTGPKSALILRKPSKIIYETLVNSKVFTINYYEMMKLCEINHEILKLSHRLLELYFVSLERRTLALGSLTAKERYLALKDKIKSFENDIPQYHIASLLGITPIQLSRIRRDLAKEI